MSFESVKTILDAHTYNTLIGLHEDAWLEVKGSTPYNFDLPEGRYELAKDVSAFANGTGGIVLVGLRTTKQETTQIEQITAFRVMPSRRIHSTSVRLTHRGLHPPSNRRIECVLVTSE
jgi:predicted HTH transcriptional regulator